MLIFNNNRAHFSATSLALNDTNVRGGKVMKPPQEKNCYLPKAVSVLAVG